MGPTRSVFRCGETLFVLWVLLMRLNGHKKTCLSLFLESALPVCTCPSKEQNQIYVNFMHGNSSLHKELLLSDCCFGKKNKCLVSTHIAVEPLIEIYSIILILLGFYISVVFKCLLQGQLLILSVCLLGGEFFYFKFCKQ